jgi:hypothetical protein
MADKIQLPPEAPGSASTSAGSEGWVHLTPPPPVPAYR